MSKTLVIDCDGTLLNSKHMLSQRNTESVKSLKQYGFRVILASARPLYRVQPILKALDLFNEDEYCISFNGGVVSNSTGKRILFKEAFSKEVFQELCKYCLDLFDSLFIYKYDSIISNQYNEGYIRNNPDAHFKCISTNELLLESADIFKISVMESKNNIYEDIILLKEEFGNVCEVHVCDNEQLVILPKNINKINALRFLEAQHILRLEDVFAIGDDYNDISMIQEAGVGIAMGNSSEQVKRVSDYISKSNDEDGVAYAIAKILAKEI